VNWKESFHKELIAKNRHSLIGYFPTKKSKDKVYSLHEPDVYCIAKGKADKKYEYVCKASIVLTQGKDIQVGAKTFASNIYDAHTLEAEIQ
jgi:IS5 family transposase